MFGQEPDILHALHFRMGACAESDCPACSGNCSPGGGSWGFGGLRAWLSTAGHIHERYQTRIVGQVGLVHGLERSENAKYILGAYVYK